MTVIKLEKNYANFSTQSGRVKCKWNRGEKNRVDSSKKWKDVKESERVGDEGGGEEPDAGELRRS